MIPCQADKHAGSVYVSLVFMTNAMVTSFLDSVSAAIMKTSIAGFVTYCSP